MTIAQIKESAISEESRQTINYYIESVENLYCTNRELNVQNNITINNRDPELLEAYKEALNNTGSHGELQDALLEIHDLIGQLNNKPKDTPETKSILQKTSDCFGKIKKLGDSIKGAAPYLKIVYSLIQPFASAHGIDLPPILPH
jgi:hypothetical protein